MSLIRASLCRGRQCCLWLFLWLEQAPCVPCYCGSPRRQASSVLGYFGPPVRQTGYEVWLAIGPIDLAQVEKLTRRWSSAGWMGPCENWTLCLVTTGLAWVGSGLEEGCSLGCGGGRSCISWIQWLSQLAWVFG